VDANFFAPPQGRTQRGGATYRFLSVLKWEYRKGWDLLLDAYWDEFSPADNVVLELKASIPPWELNWEPGLNDTIEYRLAQHADSRGQPLSALAAVKVLSDDGSRRALRHAYARADCFVLPTRGEGWGLPLTEAMAMGLPVIATNFSGPTAFMANEHSFPLPPARMLDEGRAGAEPALADVREAMRRAVADREHAAALGARARAFVVERYSAPRVAEVALRRLAEIEVAMDSQHDEADGATRRVSAPGEQRRPPGLPGIEGMKIGRVGWSQSQKERALLAMSAASRANALRSDASRRQELSGSAPRVAPSTASLPDSSREEIVKAAREFAARQGRQHPLKSDLARQIRAKEMEMRSKGSALSDRLDRQAIGSLDDSFQHITKLLRKQSLKAGEL